MKESALHVLDGVEQPSQVNPYLKAHRRKSFLLQKQDYIKGIQQGDRVILSQAITLIESNRNDQRQLAQEIVDACLPLAGNSIRIGITGVPGAGKSTFIDTYGSLLTKRGHKVAVLAIDPSSERSKGSILGDKTRMERLSVDANAFVRPSPSGNTLGGVARKTRETIILCEAAGFDRIIVETVGVGQSETAVHGMVDFFLLILISGAGDELQGIKRGIMEMADCIAINKADGDNIAAATRAKTQYTAALHLFPPTESGWTPLVETCSALEHTGVEKIEEIIQRYVQLTRNNHYFELNRRNQLSNSMHAFIEDELKNSLFSNPQMQEKLQQAEVLLQQQLKSPYKIGQELLEFYHQL